MVGKRDPEVSVLVKWSPPDGAAAAAVKSHSQLQLGQASSDNGALLSTDCALGELTVTLPFLTMLGSAGVLVGLVLVVSVVVVVLVVVVLVVVVTSVRIQIRVQPIGTTKLVQYA